MDTNSADETVQRPMDQAVDMEAPGAQVRLVFPRALEQTVLLADEPLVIGRRPGIGGLKVDDPTVSRRHIEIAWDAESGQHTVADLGSSNGSRVDGEDLASGAVVALDDGDVVRAGDVLFVYEIGDDMGDSGAVSLEAIPGSSLNAIALRSQIAACARDPSPVLLVGETGTGKEYIARELHRLSERPGPIVAINCAALSPHLIESQLFGHAKGSFTGAESAHEGVFRAAGGGTIFLDEIGELPTDLQPKLLRVLQEQEVHPVGEARPVKVDVRVVSATLRDLTTLTGTGGFRLDLYARLSPWEIRVPPVRERRADLLGWVERLHRLWHAERHDGEHEQAGPEFEANAVERLLLHPWRDNLRGVDRMVHRSCRDPSRSHIDVRESRLVGSSDRAGSPGERASTPGERPARRDDSGVSAEPEHERSDPAAEREECVGTGDEESADAAPKKKKRRKRQPRPSREDIEKALELCGGSVRATARYFDRDRRQIYRWLEHYGLRGNDDD